MDPSRDRPRVTAALTRLRSAGERVTPARYAVLRVVEAADVAQEHLTAEQIGARVAQLEPTVHRATVYRTLTSLTDAGVLSHVHLGGTATVYHLAPRSTARSLREAGKAAYGPASTEPATHGHEHTHVHVHVQCVSCGRVQDAPPHVLDDAAGRLAEQLGFELDRTHAALLGRCADCANPGAPAGERGTSHTKGRAEGPGLASPAGD